MILYLIPIAIVLVIALIVLLLCGFFFLPNNLLDTTSAAGGQCKYTPGIVEVVKPPKDPFDCGTWNHVNVLGWKAPTSGQITDSYGYRGPRPPAYPQASMHHGTDFADGCFRPVTPATNGTIDSSGYLPNNGGGEVWISSANGVRTRYLHLAATSTNRIGGTFPYKAGDKVTTASIIGYTSDNGPADGCHLHFETWINGKLYPADLVLIAMGIHVQNAPGASTNHGSDESAPVVYH